MRRHKTNALVWAAIVCWLVTLPCPKISLAGQEITKFSDTLRMTVDSRWPGSSHGGYIPLRIRLTNLGPEQDFQLVFQNTRSGEYERMPEVRRAIHLDQNATRDLTLPIPMVSMGNSGELLILDGRGKEFEEMHSTINLNEYGGDNARTSLLVIDSQSLDEKTFESFEDAAATECGNVRGLSGAGAGMRYSSNRIIETDHLIIPPISLPEEWTAYSGIDLIAVSWADLDGKLKATERDALLKWAGCGGTLIVYGTEKPAADLEALHQILQLDATTAKRWATMAIPFVQTRITSAKALNLGHSARSAFPGAPGMTTIEPAQENRVPGLNASQWSNQKNIPAFRDWSFGRIYIFQRNPFPGTAEDWCWLLASLPQNQSRWSSRMGMASRSSGSDFLYFLIPGVGTVPVQAFLILITIFTILIGPLNYYWLRKKRRVGAMVFTVPVIASVACLMLFTYSLISDGFSIRSRLHSVTFIDQQTKTAASLGRLCLYAPFAPTDGLKFSTSTAIFPIWQLQDHFESGVLDWTGNEQHFKSGWLRSQTWTQFLLAADRDERGRLDFTLPTGTDPQELTVSNGFSWNLTHLAIEAKPNLWFYGEKIPAGGTAVLKRTEPDKIGWDFGTICRENSWNLPTGMNESNQYNFGMPGGRGYGGYRHYGYGRYGVFEGPTRLKDGQLRRFAENSNIPKQSPQTNTFDWRGGTSQFNSQRHTETARPHYWAVCETSPGLEIGVQNSIDSGSLHILFGTF